MKAREGVHQAAARWEQLELVQQHYRDFVPFLEDVAYHQLVVEDEGSG